MMNLVRADLYRMRRDAAPKVAFFVLLGIALVTALCLRLLSLDSVIDALNKSIEFSQSDVADFQEIKAMMPHNAGKFVPMMMAENISCFLFLLFIITIFCEDYSYGTFRNLLSFESGRTRVYLTKLGLSVCCCWLLNLLNLLIALIVGGLFFGFGGINAAFLARQLTCMLLMLPTQLGAICFGHCISAFRQKSGSTIGIYIASLIVLTTVVQLLSMLPTFDWLLLLDWNSVGSLLYSYESMSANEILIAVGFGLLVAAVTTILGAARFKSVDLA